MNDSSYFDLDDNIVHLNHAAVAPWPIVTRDTVIAFARENSRIGSQRYASWLETEQQLKEKMARLINAESVDEIAVLKNTSEGLSVIAHGLHIEPGENIVVPDEEFPSNRIVWLALHNKGVEIRLVSLEDSDSPEQTLIDAMDQNTRLLSCSSVQYAKGLRLDLARLGEACQHNGTLFCIDGIQSLGAMRFDAQAFHADFVVADGHKWMCAPEGTALFYCRRDKQDQLSLHQHGWHMLQDAFEFSHSHEGVVIAETAQRFESGSPNMMGIAALDASLGLLLDIGIEDIERLVLANSDYLIRGLKHIDDIEILSPTKRGRYAGITTFIKHGVDNVKLYQHLQANNVICAHRGGGIRFSPHFHTEQERMDRALELVDGFA